MSDQTQTTTVPPKLLTGEQVYNLIMQAIEPELTTDQRSVLDEKYKGETPEQAKERVVRYRKAFEMYDIAYQKYMEELATAVRGYQTALRRDIEQGAKEKDSTGLTSIESALSTL